MTTPHPDQAGQVVAALLRGLVDACARLLTPDAAPRLGREEVKRTITAYVAAFGDALERVLGAPSGSLPLADPETVTASLDAWFDALAADRGQTEAPR